MKYRHFSVEEREAIQRGLWNKRSVRGIARELGRSPTSVLREIRRNLSPERFLYTPRLAHARAMRKRLCRGRKDRLKNSLIRDYVATHLKRSWSPEQIAGRLAVDQPGLGISHEAIYQFIYAQVSSASSLPHAGQEDLRPFLKRRHRLRVSKGGRRAWRLMKPHGPSIDTRPAIVEMRSRVGDWEGDTVESVAHKPGINTLVERRSGFACITKLGGKTARDTSLAAVSRLSQFPLSIRHTMTVDNGPENSGWKTIQNKLNIAVYFAHAYHSWERGTNENTNGLIRHYFPKRTDFTMIPESELSQVEWELNNRPRKRLGWKTPQEVFGVALQG
ncbi:MAG: IS30 family transposase [bacterium]|nr:IS30 family transposase [bacterium]